MSGNSLENGPLAEPRDSSTINRMALSMGIWYTPASSSIMPYSVSFDCASSVTRVSSG